MHRIRAGTDNLLAVAVSFQQILTRHPHHPEALIGMSLVALASGQFGPALTMARAATAAAPSMSMAWVTLGQALKADGRIGEAELAYEHALDLEGRNGLAHLGLGELRMATNRPEEALEAFQTALHWQPSLLAAHMGAGHALACSGRDEDALRHYRQALLLAPQSAEAEFAIAFFLARMGKAMEAEAHYRDALMLRPDFGAAWMNLGCLLREQGKMPHAAAALTRAVELRPDVPAGWVNLALLAREQRRTGEARHHLLRAFALNPESVDTLLAWCQFCIAEEDRMGAWEWLRWAQTRSPSHPEVANTHGMLLHMERRFAEAAETFTQAEACGSAAAVSNLGNTLLNMGRIHEALQAHERAAASQPQSAGAEYNLALTRLRLGEWKRGWAGYEARWRFREVHPFPRIFQCPRWHGEPLEGRRILLYAEQGLGDAIQFCRYAPLVAASGAQVILQVHPPLVRLMHSLAAAQAGHISVVALGEEPPDFVLECPLMSLPAVFGTTLETVPWSGPYLGPSPEQRISRRPGSPDHPGALRVGIAWAGNPRYKADTQRSMRLDTLVPLLRQHPEIHWISLQKGESVGQLRQLPRDLPITDGCSLDQDLADAAALIATLDLVITTDTSIAHLAGAISKPVWILLPHLSDWRWMQDVETTPWYPTARLFRQATPGDWDGTLGRVSTELT